MSIRKNITMSDKLAGWYEDRAKEMGISQSALMAMALQFYTEYQQTLKLSSNFKNWIDKIEELKEGIEK